MGRPPTATFAPVFADGTLHKVPIITSSITAESLHIAVEDSGPSKQQQQQPGRQLTFLCLPGLGDVRQSYRFLAPKLHAKGHRVLLADLRGSGDSDAAFPSFTPLDVSSDIGSILKFFNFDSDVVLVANSLAGSSVLHFAATNQSAVSAIVCLAPVARDLPQDATFRTLSYALFCHPWGVPLWVSYFSSLFKLHPPSDLNEYKRALSAKMWEKGRLAATAGLIRGSKAPCYEAISNVKCPVLLLHGEKDPDFADPSKEGEEVKAALTSAARVQVEVYEGVGHYPHVEEPQQSYDTIVAFLDG